MPKYGQYDPDSGTYTIDENLGGGEWSGDRAHGHGPGSPYSDMPTDYIAVNGYGNTPGGNQQPAESPAGPSFTWNNSQYQGGGLTGSESKFGNNFIGMQGYLNANKSPGLNDASYNSFSAGPNGNYSKNMNSLDSSLYGFYGVKGQQAAQPSVAQNAAQPTAASGTPQAQAQQPQTQQGVTNNYVGMQNKLKTGGRTYVQ